MNSLRAAILYVFLFAVLCLSATAQEKPSISLEPLSPESQIEFFGKTRMIAGTNGVIVKYEGAVLSANTLLVNSDTGEAEADGKVRLQRDNLTWTGDHLRYNFKTRQLWAERFRAGRSPVFVGGSDLRGVVSQQIKGNTNVYSATNAFVTTDDLSDPTFKIRARQVVVVPGHRIEARHAVLYLGGVPCFYYPYYSRTLRARDNNFTYTPGYQSRFGPYVRGTYTWFWDDQVDGAFHLDYRERRGVGAGPDLNLHMGAWGEAKLRYYYLNDQDAGTNFYGRGLPENRQRVALTYQADPATNLNVKSVVRYQGDSDVVKNFYEGEYRRDPQPATFVEVNKFWENFSLDTLAQPRVNNFFDTVERLPDVRLSGFRQQLGDTPLYYESETSAGYYRHVFAETNGPSLQPAFEAGRADTYHQVTLPQTCFGWLNLTPRAGGRFTCYSASDGLAANTQDAYRRVFNTGAEVSFKTSRIVPGYENRFLEMDGVRHILVPSVNYVYVPTPNARPGQLPQFDAELPSLRQLPIEFPEYNAIDSVDSQNVIRYGLQNKVQTKRAGQVEDFLNWQLLTDWRLQPAVNQPAFADVYSDLTLRPRSWLGVQSQTRFDPDHGQWRLLQHSVTFEPNNVWSWTVGHFYLRDDLSASPTALGRGNSVVTSSMFYRMNENWGFRTTHHFDARDGRMQEQYYTIYRDLRSWTGAVSLGVRDNGTGPKEFMASFTFSIKAMPRFGLGSDTVRPYSLLSGS